MKRFGSFLRINIYRILYRLVVVDLVFSAGPNCRPANMLKKIGMRTFSSPLDWMMVYDLSTYVDLLKEKDFPLFQEYEEDEQKSGEDRYVKDLQTGMISMHHFPKNQSIQKSFPHFVDKMNRRLEKLICSIQQNKDIGIVMARDIPLEEIENFVRSLSGVFPECTFHILNIRHSEIQSRLKWRKIVKLGSCHHTIREVCFNDVHPEGGSETGNIDWWKGNQRLWEKALKRTFSLRKSHLNMK